MKKLFIISGILIAVNVGLQGQALTAPVIIDSLCLNDTLQSPPPVVNVRIERGNDKTTYQIDLIVENLSTEDTLLIASKYFIDEYYPPNRIFIYLCKKIDSTDSIKCDWGYSHGDIARNSVSFSNERIIKILPKQEIILKMPISHYYIGDEIYLEIRMACSKGKPEDAFLLTKTTNKILFEREPSKHEKYQDEKIRERLQKKDEK